MLENLKKRLRRHKKIRAKIYGTTTRPRLSVFRSLKHIYVQIINDEKGITLVAANDLELKNVPHRHTHRSGEKEKVETVKTKKVNIAYELGKLIAKKASEKKIKKVIFDRGGFSYHGRIKALAEGAREGGLEF